MSVKSFVIISGMAGAGKSAALKDLEDLNYFCVDNLPPALLPKFANLSHKSGFEKVAVAVDHSSKSFSKDVIEAVEVLPEYDFKPIFLFIDASDDMLIRRFSASYRRHPMTESENRILGAIRKERVKLEEIRGMSDIIVDTTDISLKKLKDEITRLFFNSDGKANPITATILSFGYKFGLPRDADIVFDARVLPNPYYDPNLKPFDGRDAKIKDYVFGEDCGKEFLKKVKDLSDFMLPLYISNGKSHLTIAVGCTGGKHRSVAVAESLGLFLEEKNYKIFRKHRDLDKEY